jgi:hypothetical protein
MRDLARCAVARKLKMLLERSWAFLVVVGGNGVGDHCGNTFRAMEGLSTLIYNVTEGDESQAIIGS